MDMSIQKISNEACENFLRRQIKLVASTLSQEFSKQCFWELEDLMMISNRLSEIELQLVRLHKAIDRWTQPPSAELILEEAKKRFGVGVQFHCAEIIASTKSEPGLWSARIYSSRYPEGNMVVLRQDGCTREEALRGLWMLLFRMPEMKNTV
jgi:predicted enzyme involved in methoxymalonyl-ACP biosynthesis